MPVGTHPCGAGLALLRFHPTAPLWSDSQRCLLHGPGSVVEWNICLRSSALLFVLKYALLPFLEEAYGAFSLILQLVPWCNS